MRGIKLNANGYIQISSSEIGACNQSYKEKLIKFEELAKEELKELNSDERKNKFMIIYRSSGYTYHACTVKDILYLSLAPQEYICSAMVKTVKSCNKCAVYINSGKGNYKELWTINPLSQDKNAIFLYPEKLTKVLKKIFPNFQLTLGLLEKNNFKSIAWQITISKEECYYILWHNGCICPNDNDFIFTQKTIKDLRRTYKTLRFISSYENQKEYKTLFA